jgi:hypothetical protein
MWFHGVRRKAMKDYLKLLVATVAFAALGIAAAADLTAAQVKSRLEAAGYTNVKNIKKEGDHFDAMATAKDGKRVALDVDAQTGAITPEAKETKQQEKNEHK